MFLGKRHFLHIPGQLLISIFLFAFVFFALVSASLIWGFWVDDCGILFNSQVQSIQDFFQLFYGKDFYSLCLPSNYHYQQLSFLSVFYRPLTRVLFALQLPFFGNQPYGYFVVTMFFHALNTTLLFNIFVHLFKAMLWAVLGALLFAFHPTLVGWIGWIAAQPYQVGLFLLLLSLILFFSYVRGRSRWFLCVSCVLYALALFLFEITIVYPVFLVFLFFIINEMFPLFSMPFVSYLKKILCFGFVNIFFLIVRVVQYPLSGAQAHRPIISLGKVLSNRLLQIKSFFFDISNVLVLSLHNHTIRVFIIGIVYAFFVFLYMRNSHKKLLFWLGASMFVFMWAAFVTVYVTRYFYFALPLFVAFVISSIVFVKSKYARLIQNIVACVLVGIIGANMVHMRKDIFSRGTEWHLYTDACRLLLLNPVINNSTALLFVGLPMHQFQTALAQRLWFFGLATKTSVFCDTRTFCSLAHETMKNPLNVVIDHTKIQMSSRDAGNFYWKSNFDNNRCGLGHLVVNQCEAEKQQAYALTYYLDKRYCAEGTVFVTWDYAAKNFKIL